MQDEREAEFHNSAAYRLGWRDYDDHGDNRARLTPAEQTAYDKGWQAAHDFDQQRGDHLEAKHD